MSWTPYPGDRYLTLEEIGAWCQEVAQAHPGFVSLESLGESGQGRPLWMLVLGDRSAPGELDQRPGFWLDAGTHAAEWTGVMSAIFSASRWIQAWEEGDEATRSWFAQHTVYIMPCVSPDGFQAMVDGLPYLRSSLRPPPPGTVRSGMEPRDMDGDGKVRWMRWFHPAGPWVDSEAFPGLPRRRSLSDAAESAYFLCQEGEFIQWDGRSWISAEREHGMDLNRNFPVRWSPFRMFGMDGGVYPLSEPESRALVEALVARPHIGAAVTNHTYTGALLTQPYDKDDSMSDGDLYRMEALAKQAVEGTGYKAVRVHPDFTYDPKKSVVGVWADCLSNTFGIPGFTLELWDPLAPAGLEVDKPLDLFRNADPELFATLIRHYVDEDPACWSDWRPLEHPQLGRVEVGGLEYMRTIRNPPERHLPEECERGFKVADTVRRALARVEPRLDARAVGEDLWELELSLENLGFLSTAGLDRCEQRGLIAPPSACLELGEGLEQVDSVSDRPLGHLDGWGHQQGFGSGNPLYASLPARGHRQHTRWLLRGSGQASVRWWGARGGQGLLTISLG